MNLYEIFIFTLGWLSGHYKLNDRINHAFICCYWWCRGWRKVKGPWGLYEKQYKSGLKYRTPDFKGMKAADIKYKATGSPIVFASK